MSNEKIYEQISKLEAANGNLTSKIALNKTRLRILIGKSAGVKLGDVVVSKGQRYRVSGVVSEAIPAKGKPVLSALRIAKNGNLGKRLVEIRAWSVEGPTIVPKKEIVRVSSKRAGGKILTKKPAKRGSGRPSKKSLEDFTILGTA
jgi:hypothetical protein